MVHYIAYYSTKDGDRIANFAGEDKIDYICEALISIGNKVRIISNVKSKKQYLPTEIVMLETGAELRMFASLPYINIVTHAIDVLWGYIQLICYILKHVKKDDTVLVYHSLGYRNLFSKLRRIKKFRYLLEVEELFQYIDAAKSSFKSKEDVVFEVPDGFLFSNEILANRVNIKNKPSVIINGIYKIQKSFTEDKDENHIHIVYAGTLERQKGVDYVIKVAPFLPEKYRMHIIGFGSEKDIKRVKGLIEQSNLENQCVVSYDGLYKGDEYLKFMQNCDIGICVQDEADEFNKYEYPSKIFSYLSNGLQVVVNNLEQVANSSVAPYLIISDSTNPKDIAKAILDSKGQQIKSEELLKLLDKEFKKEMHSLISTTIQGGN